MPTASTSTAARSSSAVSSHALDTDDEASSASRSTSLAAAPPVKMHPSSRRPRRDHAHVDWHADRRLVAACARLHADPVRLHQHAGLREDAGSAREVGRDPLCRRRRERARSSRACRCGATRCRGRTRPRRRTSARWAQTDDIRPGLGCDGLETLQNFIARRRRVHRVGEHAPTSRSRMGSRTGSASSTPPRLRSWARCSVQKMADETSPIAYGISDNLAVYSADGEASASAQRGAAPAAAVVAAAVVGGRGGGGRRPRDGSRHARRRRRRAGSSAT